MEPKLPSLGQKYTEAGMQRMKKKKGRGRETGHTYISQRGHKIQGKGQFKLLLEFKSLDNFIV